MSKLPENRRLYGLQILRFFASSIVVLYHASKHADGQFIFGLFDLGYSGVDIFFVLSGFVITSSLSRRDDGFDLSNFFRARFFRIYPSYWMFLFVPLACIALFVPGLSPDPALFTNWSIILSFFLVFGHPVISQVTWTLSYELFFYLIYGFLVRFNRVKAIWIYGILILLTNVLFDVNSIFLIKYVFNLLVLEFILGILAFRVIEMNRISVRTLWFVLLVAILWFVLGSINYLELKLSMIREYRLFVFGLPSFLLIFAISGLEKSGNLSFRMSWFTRFGDSSYVLYLIHSPIVSIASVFLPISYYTEGMILVFFISTLVSWWLFKWVDRPVYLKLKGV